MTESWTLMNSHGVVLFYIAAHQEVTMREMSVALDITERRVAQIVKDLRDAELLEVERVGRRNIYSVNKRAPFRHPTLRNVTLGQFEELLANKKQVAEPACHSERSANAAHFESVARNRT